MYMWRGGIVGNNINSESQGSRFKPLPLLGQLMSRDTAKQACSEMYVYYIIYKMILDLY